MQEKNKTCVVLRLIMSFRMQRNVGSVGIPVSNRPPLLILSVLWAELK